MTAADDKEDALHKVKSVNQLMEELKHKRKDMVNELKKKEAEEEQQQRELKAMIDKQRILKKAEEKRNMVDQMRNQLEVRYFLIYLFTIIRFTFIVYAKTPDDMKLPPLPPPSDLPSTSMHEEKLLKREENKKKLKRILLMKKLRELEEEKKTKGDDGSKVGENSTICNHLYQVDQNRSDESKK